MSLSLNVRKLVCIFLVGGGSLVPLRGEAYPDQFFSLKGADSLLAQAETVSNLVATADRQRLQLAEQQTVGFIIFKPQTMPFPYNYGLPSWNGSSPATQAYFKVLARFPYGNSWSPWLTVGYWNQEWGSSYGTTSYDGGMVDIDEIELYSYQTTFQMAVYFFRSSTTIQSPTLRKISLTLSDTRTTAQLDYTAILNDNPPPLFIPTTFYYQYALDPEIGGSICSPTSVSMILRSFGIEVDPLQFAIGTKDPYWGIYGVWPRVVQHAAEYGLDGAVTQYRSWSQAYEVLSKGGRIAMSVGKPLYTGHLMMLAGFTSTGQPIVHDPARSTGYGYLFSKSELSHSWFDKGGVSYTFYPDSAQSQLVCDRNAEPIVPAKFVTIWNYPNPFNISTTICLEFVRSGEYAIQVFDLSGRSQMELDGQFQERGLHRYQFSGEGLSSGIYFIRVTDRQGQSQSARMLLLK